MKIYPVGAELFHADGRTDGPTDMTKLIIVFRNFANAPKNVVTCFPKRNGCCSRYSNTALANVLCAAGQSQATEHICFNLVSVM